MSAQRYEQRIIESIRGLPEDALARIADYALFVRMRTFQPQLFDAEAYGAALNVDLHDLGQACEAHLESEWEEYDRIRPGE